MTFDMFESAALNTSAFDLSEKMAALRSGFESRIEPKNGSYISVSETADDNIARWIGCDVIGPDAVDLSTVRLTALDVVKQMCDGVVLEDGGNSLCLKDIHNWKVNPEFVEQNIKQHAGFAAEVISTAKENLRAELDKTGITTWRADDRPDLFQKNDQYVDKIRVNESGDILERIQTKFVGDNPKECFEKLTSKKYDKYFDDGMIDKIEIPKDYYEGVKRLIPEKLEELEEQLARVNEDGNTKTAEHIEARIQRLQKMDQMLEKSMVTRSEALYATNHPVRYAVKLFAEDTFLKGNEAGLESAAIAASITAAVSTVDNVVKVMNGELTPKEAFVDVAKDTGISGGLAYGTAFVSTAVTQAMSASSHQLLNSLGSAGVPAAVVSFGVQSYDSIMDFADGTIDGQQLAYDLGENTARIGGSIAGSALAGAALGSVVPGAGTAVGFGVGLVGGMVGCAVASGAYTSAVKIGAENAGVLADKAQELADRTVEAAKEVVPDKVGNIISSINDFASANSIPINV